MSSHLTELGQEAVAAVSRSASIPVRGLRIVLRDRLPELVEGPKQILC